MPIFKIQHITKYLYDRPVQESVNEVKIFPYQCDQQETLQFELTVTGQPVVDTFHDYWGNRTGIFNLLGAHKELVIESRVVVRVIPAGPGSRAEDTWERLCGDLAAQLPLLELAAARPVAKQHEVDVIAENVRDENSVASTLERCNEYIYKHFDYIKGITTVEATVDDILEHRAGVCQDFAHLMLQVLRTLGVPSRYVSGYICPNKTGMRGEGATHAWVEAWLPGRGWTGIDPTNNIWVNDKHVKLAVGRDFADCSPVKGTFKGPARQQLSVYVSIGYEDGRVFEETNKVRLLSQPGPEDDDLFDESLAAQQQQQ